MTHHSEATWRSGDAADCKSVYAGSIPAVASIFPDILLHINAFSAGVCLRYVRFTAANGLEYVEHDSKNEQIRLP